MWGGGYCSIEEYPTSKYRFEDSRRRSRNISTPPSPNGPRGSQTANLLKKNGHRELTCADGGVQFGTRHNLTFDLKLYYSIGDEFTLDLVHFLSTNL